MKPSSEDPAAEKREGANSHYSGPQELIGKTSPIEPETPLNKAEPDMHSGSSTCPSKRHSRKLRWRRSVNSDQVFTGTDQKTCLKKLMLRWGKDDSDRLVFNLAFPSADTNVEAPNYISWQHSEHSDMRLTDLEDIISLWKSHGLPDNEFGLIMQLLKKVAAVAQNAFIGGSFLTPLALRYDILKDSRYNLDKSCIFLSFPYFAVAKAQGKRAFQKGDKEHPVRALLQTHYRLIDTTDRDNMQIIKILEGTNLKQCINGPREDVGHLSSSLFSEVIHVPQMWALIMGSNKLASIGPISEQALLGPSIKLNQDKTLVKATPCSFLRISFLNDRKIEEITYPIDYCASWFGLMNKASQIRKIIDRGSIHVPSKYRFQTGKRVIECTTWASLQQSATEEILDIWMLTPAQNNTLRDDASRVLDFDSADDRIYDLTEAVPANRVSGLRDTDSPKPRPAPAPVVVRPFLLWPIKDEPEESSQLLRTSRFLETIYSSLPAVCHVNRVDRTHNIVEPESNSTSRLSTRSKISIEGKTEQEVATLAQSPKPLYLTRSNKSESFFLGLSRLLAYFVPKDHDQNSAAIQLYWGAIYELLSHYTRVDDLFERVEEINARAEAIHHGVYFQQSVITPDGKLIQQDAISGSARLLASIIDALGAVFDMIVQAVCDFRSPRGITVYQGTKTRHYASNACKLLETARDELIAESTGFPPDENIGSVLTPQTILIVLMERLGTGVYGSGSVDITAIYDECLAQLALKVRSRASRRLLQTINAFDEEVTIVENVLDEQEKVLLEFRAFSDPRSFKTTKTPRRLKFENESKAIDRIRHRIKSQKSTCAELKQRAKALAVQNVQLVETLQDDNSRAILIFTLITVLFLPLSFVAGFFGMNVAGINPTTSTTRHFWAVALPLTGGILLLCAFVLLVGEGFWVAVNDAPRRWWMKIRRRGTRQWG